MLQPPWAILAVCFPVILTGCFLQVFCYLFYIFLFAWFFDFQSSFVLRAGLQLLLDCLNCSIQSSMIATLKIYSIGCRDCSSELTEA